MNLKHNQRTPKGVITLFEMGQQTTKLKRYIDPLHIVGMQPIWGAKQMKFSLLGIEIFLFCPPDWLHSHRRARGLLDRAG